jgi:hypothetical protein
VLEVVLSSPSGARHGIGLKVEGWRLDAHL